MMRTYTLRPIDIDRMEVERFMAWLPDRKDWDSATRVRSLEDAYRLAGLAS